MHQRDLNVAVYWLALHSQQYFSYLTMSQRQ